MDKETTKEAKHHLNSLQTILLDEIASLSRPDTDYFGDTRYRFLTILICKYNVMYNLLSIYTDNYFDEKC